MLSNVFAYSFLPEVEDQSAAPVQRVQAVPGRGWWHFSQIRGGTQRSLVKMLRALAL
jgi:hypothetical protein